jgi:hypothetical protein
MNHKAWWEWLLLALGCFGGVNALITVIDRVFLRSPKIVGKIHQVFGGYFDPSECEILLLVSAVNKRSQSTTLSDWKLIVERDGQRATGIPFRPPEGHRIWPRTKAASPQFLWMTPPRYLAKALRSMDGLHLRLRE